MPNSVEYEIYNGIEKLPHFNPELDNDQPPAEVQVCRELLSRADGVIICTPEYIKGVPGVLKNAHQALQLNLSMLNANVFDRGALLI